MLVWQCSIAESGPTYGRMSEWVPLCQQPSLALLLTTA